MEERQLSGLRAEPARPEDIRGQVDTAAREALLRRDTAQLAAQALRDVRRDLAVARVELETAQAAADGRHVVDLKTEARGRYQRALAGSRSADARQHAAATWLREIDRINRASRAALDSLVEWQARTIALRQRVDSMERTADAERIRAESAAAAHVDARDRLADGEEMALLRRLAEGAESTGSGLLERADTDADLSGSSTGPGSGSKAGASLGSGAGGAASRGEGVSTGEAAASLQRALGATPGGTTEATTVPGTLRALTAVPIEPSGDPDALLLQGRSSGFGATPRVRADAASEAGSARATAGPLAIEGLLAGDREALRGLAREMAEITGRMPSRYLLLLQELVDGLTTAAVEAGRLAFDHRHPLWSQFNEEQSRTIARALRDLGFRFDPREGWYGGRAPSSPDLALALAYAGFDVRRMRRLPAGAELRELPSSVAVATLEFVAAAAPDLAVGQVMRLLGHAAEPLGDLWDDWGQLRSLLLQELSVVNA